MTPASIAAELRRLADSIDPPHRRSPVAPAAGKDPLAVAAGEIGVREIEGAEHNPRIQQYHAATRGDDGDSPDELPWCSSFLCWVFEQCGISHPASKASRTWRTWGDEVTLEDARPGDVVVFDYGDGKGHVGLLVLWEVDASGRRRLCVRGGNQKDGVRDTWFRAGKLHSVRRLA